MAEKPFWKQCADWLCQLEVLPSNHRIMWPDASIQVRLYLLGNNIGTCIMLRKLKIMLIQHRIFI